MTIIEYTLELQGELRTIPSYAIPDGGYWWNPDGSDKIIAVVSDDNVPEGATTYTLEELQARQRTIHAKYPMLKDPMDMDAGNMTDDEVDTMIKDWVDAR